MCRTFRRKNYEDTKGNSWSRRGRKTFGYYTESGWKEVGFKECWNRGNTFYRVPTQQEYYKEYYRVHGDNHRSQWSPGKWFRKTKHAENKTLNNSELSKWMKNPDGYEPVFEANPRSNLWDWE